MSHTSQYLIGTDCLIGADESSRTIPSVGAPSPVAPTIEDVRADRAVLKQGMQGDSVSTVQGLLHRSGYLAPTPGVFDDKMTIAVTSYQKAKGLKVDGEVGPETLHALEWDKPDVSPSKSSKPSRSSSPSSAPSPGSGQYLANVNSSTPPPAADEGLPWWGWYLIVSAVGAAAFFGLTYALKRKGLRLKNPFDGKAAKAAAAKVAQKTADLKSHGESTLAALKAKMSEPKKSSGSSYQDRAAAFAARMG